MARITIRQRDTIKVDHLIIDKHALKGNTYYVDSVGGNIKNGGLDPLDALATIDQAVNKCTANQGDVIVVLQKHAETIGSATALVLDIAGISIIGMGHGTTRPTITLDTATAASIPVSVDDIHIENIIFTANFADIVTMFTLTTAKQLTFVDCNFLETATNMNAKLIVDTNTTNNAANGLAFINCNFIQVDTANTSLIKVDGDLDNLKFKDNYVSMGVNDNNAVIAVATGKDLTNVEIVDNLIYRLNTVGDLVTDSDTTNNSGIVARNYVGHADTASEVLFDLDGARVFENRGTAVNNTQGYLVPVVDS
jgi:hypothetical protein